MPRPDPATSPAPRSMRLKQPLGRGRHPPKLGGAQHWTAAESPPSDEKSQTLPPHAYDPFVVTLSGEELRIHGKRLDDPYEITELHERGQALVEPRSARQEITLPNGYYTQMLVCIGLVTKFAQLLPHRETLLQHRVCRLGIGLADLKQLQQIYSQQIECPRSAPGVTHFPVERHSLFVQCAGRGEVAFLQGQGAEDGLTPRDAPTLVDLLAQSEALPQEAPPGFVAASILTQPAQVNEHPGRPTVILMLPIQSQTLLEHRAGGRDVVLIQRQNTAAVEHLGP